MGAALDWTTYLAICGFLTACDGPASPLPPGPNGKVSISFINFCFSYWQFIKGLDTRYDSFFSVLMADTNEGPKLPSYIKIISWKFTL